MAGNIKTRGSQPQPQDSRGYPRADVANPKNNSARRPDVIRRDHDVPGALAASGNSVSDTYADVPGGAATKNGGSPSGIPDDNRVNRGYVVVTGGDVATSNPGANRQRFPISPGSQTLGDTVNGAPGGGNLSTGGPRVVTGDGDQS